MELASFYSNHFKSFAQAHKNYYQTEWFLAKPTESSYAWEGMYFLTVYPIRTTDSVWRFDSCYVFT